MLPIILLWVLPIASVVAWFALMSVREDAAVKVPEAKHVAVGRTTDALVTPVRVEVRFGEPERLLSRADGMVTAVAPVAAEAIVSGQHLISVDDVVIRAQVAEAPIVDSVGPQSVGPDVERVAHLLVSAGYLEVFEGTTYTAALGRSINLWNADAGIPTNGVFDPSTTVFVPGAHAEFDRLRVDVGVPVASGEEIGTLRGVPEKVRFESATDTSLGRLGEQAVTLSFGDESMPLENREAASSSPDILGFLEGAAQRGDATVIPGENTTTYEGGKLQLTEPTPFGTVPTDAVYIAEGGQACVFVPEGKEYAATRLEQAHPVGSSGVTAVDAGLAGLSIAADASSLPAGVLTSCT